MPYKIGLISDIHAYPEPLKEALQLFNKKQVNCILCAGDIAGYGEQLDQSIKLLQKYNCQSVKGNHEEQFLASPDKKITADTYQYISQLPDFICLDIHGASLHMVHTEPGNIRSKGIRLLNKDESILDVQKDSWLKKLKRFKYDILIVGHTHQVFSEQLGSTLVINPGSTQFNHSCAILTLPEKTCEFYALSGLKIKKTWNWSDVYSSS